MIKINNYEVGFTELKILVFSTPFMNNNLMGGIHQQLSDRNRIYTSSNYP